MPAPTSKIFDMPFGINEDKCSMYLSCASITSFNEMSSVLIFDGSSQKP